MKATVAETPIIEVRVFGSNFIRPANNNALTTIETIPMFKRFKPRADKPPSAKTRACRETTTVITKIATYGPTNIEANAPPIKWPLVPAATGKFII